VDLSLNEREARLKQEARQFMEREAPKDILLELERRKRAVPGTSGVKS